MAKLRSKLQSSTSKSPVTDQVEQLLPDIARSLENGESQASIFKKLKASGHSVGAGPSSFNHALRQFKPQLEELRARIHGNEGSRPSSREASPEAESGADIIRPNMPSQSNAEADNAPAGGSTKAESVATELAAKRPLLLLCANDAGGQFSTTLARTFHALCLLGSTTPVLIDANPGAGQLSDYHRNAFKLPAHFASVHVPGIIKQVSGRNVIIDIGCNPLWLGPDGSGGLSALVEGFASAGYDCFCYLSVTPHKPGDLTRLAQIVGRFPRAEPYIVLNQWYLAEGMNPTDVGYPDKSKYPYPTVELDWMGTVHFKRVEASATRSLFAAIAERGLIGDYSQTALIDWLRNFAGTVPHRANLASAFDQLGQLDRSIPRPWLIDRP